MWWSLKELTANDKRQIAGAIDNGNFGYIVPGIAVIILSHWLRAVRWRIIIGSMGYKPGKLNTFFAVMIGYLANQAVPRLGELLRCSTLTRYEKIPLDKLLGTVILERVVDTICLLFVFLLALALQPYLYNNIVQTFFSAQPAVNSSTVLGVLAGAIITASTAFILFLLFTKRKLRGWLTRLQKIVFNLWQGFISIKDLKRPWMFTLLSVLIWLLYIASVYIGFMMFQETRQCGIKEALTVLSAGTLAIMATPGGIGAYAFLVQKTMSLYQLNSGVGLALGWLLWLLQTCVVLVLGVLSIISLPFYNKKKAL